MGFTTETLYKFRLLERSAMRELTINGNWKGAERLTISSAEKKTAGPNAHGGLHHCPNNSTLQPLSNRYQNFSSRIRVGPLEVQI
ncbi:hypothetical protein LguiB_009119 [Lonicera macranthoides]